MKKVFLTLVIASIGLSVSAQIVAIREIKEPIEGICNRKAVYALFPGLDGHEEAISPITKEEILKRLNSEIDFLKNNPKYKDKGMIGLIINCKGEVVDCEMDINTQSPELDKQIEEVFNSLGAWNPGRLFGKEVDSTVLFSFKIKKGVIRFN